MDDSDVFAALVWVVLVADRQCLEELARYFVFFAMDAAFKDWKEHTPSTTDGWANERKKQWPPPKRRKDAQK